MSPAHPAFDARGIGKPGSPGWVQSVQLGSNGGSSGGALDCFATAMRRSSGRRGYQPWLRSPVISRSNSALKVPDPAVCNYLARFGVGAVYIIAGVARSIKALWITHPGSKDPPNFE
jgi:hypothetical protein